MTQSISASHNWSQLSSNFISNRSAQAQLPLT